MKVKKFPEWCGPCKWIN